MFKYFPIALVCLFYNLNGYSQSIFKGLNNDNSTFLLGAVNARKSQCIYKPSDFNTIPNNGEITKIYYRYGTTGITAAHDLSPFTIKLGQTADTVFGGGNTFYTNLSTVRMDSVFTIPAGAQGDWFGIDLQTPFAYDSSKSLIVEIKFYNSTGTAFGTMGNDNSGQKIISSDTASVVAVGSSTTWQDFGFDYLIPTGKSNINTFNDIMIYPNPSNGLITINNLPRKINKTISVIDVYGKLVLSKIINSSQTTEVLNINEFENGIYFLKIDHELHSTTKKIIKN
jgi:hypothetical protein